MNERDIFEKALAIAGPEERLQYIEAACAQNENLRRHIEGLIFTHKDLGSFLQVPPIVGASPVIDQILVEKPGTQIGPYKLLQQIGEGGMGTVFMAEQIEPVKRKVALKVIKPGMDSRQVIARFEAERQALAVMDHVNISRVLDAGATESGRPYFVMELVHGLPITKYCDDAKMTPRQRLELFVPVCKAIQHAHQNGIIHRDIKPSNVMVTLYDGKPVPKVIDFGVAKATEQKLTERTLFTQYGTMIGTLEYMSPEQAEMNALGVDTRSDIYSLGVLLYELLTGSTPLSDKRMKETSFAEILRLIKEEEPPKPSTRLNNSGETLVSISAQRQMEPAKLTKMVRGELDWIVMKALDKDRNRRYDTANEFADDVQRFLNDEAVHACPPSAIYRFRKLASRNRASLSAATLVAAALIIGTAVATWQAIQARDSQAQTEIAKQQLDERYRIAKEAVDTYLLRVTQDEQLDHPSFRQLRHKLLEAALPYYDQLHKIAPTDEQSKAARAETLNQLGGVKRDLGRFDESLASFEESAKLFDQLSADNTAKIDYRQSLAKVLVNLADHYRTRGASSESLEYEQHALALRQQLASEHPDNDLLHLELAQSYTNVGVGTQEIDGREMLERAIEIWQELADRFPYQTLYREYLSLGYQNLANRFAWDQAEQAIPFHELAIGLLEQLAKEQPESKKAHIQWAQSHRSLADTLEKLSPRLSDAREHCEESIRILSAYAKRHPESPEVKSHLANSLTKLSHTLKELDELGMAHETCDSALRLWEQLQLEYPDMLEYEVGMAAAQQNLGAIVVAQGQATEGMSMLTQSRDRLQKLVDRIGPHDRSNELLRTITSSLADTRKVLGQGREPSSEESTVETNIKSVGEALRPSKFLTDLSNSPTHGLRVGGMVPSLSQTGEQDQSMKRLRNQLSRSASRPQIRNERPLRIEQLEARQLFASLSVSNVTINEIGSPSAFVTAGSGGLSSPSHSILGSDGNLYVASKSASASAVLRYNGTTGAFIDTFVTSGAGGLSNPGAFGMAFGPDGNLYVASGGTNQVLEYNGTTGAFIKVFVSAGSGGLNYPRAVTFGSDGSLYVTSSRTSSILRYQGPLASSPGAPLPAPGQSGATFVAPSSGGLLSPIYAIFGPDGNLYVDGSQTVGILRYNGTTGAFIDTFVPGGRGNLAYGRGMVFDPDGRLYVADSGDGVHRYDAQGNFLGDLLVNAVSPTLHEPMGLTFDDQGALLISCSGYNSVVRYDRGVVVSLSAASLELVSVNYATTDGTALASTDYFAQSGTVTFKPGQTTRRILLATQDDLEADASETFAVQLSNPSVGATIDTGTGVVTIADDDSTRQLSIGEASALEGDHTPHYRGAFVEGIPGNSFQASLTFGPDGNLYTSTGSGPGEGGVDRYNGTTGAFIDHFVEDGLTPGTRDPLFHGDYLYVASEYRNKVLRFNASTGAFVSVFVDTGTVGPNIQSFGPDGNLYVGFSSAGVVRYNGTTGDSMGTFIAPGSGGLSGPRSLTFDPTGSYLYISSSGSNQILKYNAQNGAYVGVAASAGIASPQDVKFGPDGLMYVLSAGNNRILRFAANGTYVDDYVPAGSGGMVFPLRMAFGPDGDLYVTAFGTSQNIISRILRFGTENEAIFTVSNTTPSTLPVTVNYTTSDGNALAGIDYTASTGTLTFAPGVTSETIRIPILDDTTTEPTETFAVNLSNPVAATIAVGQGIGSILDNDPFTKFYVVNDASTDRTYEYGETGTSVENYALAGGNTAPRGAASTTLGTTVWIVDANKSVYVYDTSGALQGSWAAGGLQSTAQLEGIATNGTDVWLVDNKTDKVYRYAKAAPLTNGSPVATSSFSLNSGNTSPKDIVTDGNYLWVVNDSTTDKVFKYTIGGTYVGSWTISTPGASSPTGITLDPSNPAHIWIVDSGTDKVYQYKDSTGLTFGSRSANSSWALDANNTNPQGIADPPPPSSMLSSPNLGSSKGVATEAVALADVGPVPMLWFGTTSFNTGSATLPRVETKARSIDDIMRTLGRSMQMPQSTAAIPRTSPVVSRESMDPNETDELEIAEDDTNDLICQVANNLWR